MVYGKEWILMCGRYVVADEAEIIEMREILAQINQQYADAMLKTGDIFPTNIAPVLLPTEGGHWEARPMSWGFPRWDNKGVIINARSETAFEKPMFRTPLLTKRCVIPSTGFYEWQHVDGKAKKDKYLITVPGNRMLYMAGIYNTFRRQDGSEIPGYVILTTVANESMEQIHDRMPVILRKDELGIWLSNTESVQRYFGQSRAAVKI